MPKGKKFTISVNRSPNETPKEKSGANTQGNIDSPASSIFSLNNLPEREKISVYSRLIPQALIDRFGINKEFQDNWGNNLLQLNCPSGRPIAEMWLYHRHDFPDPVLYGQIGDTLNEQIHVFFYVLNDPTSPRFDIDRMPDGQPTNYGVLRRNIPAEIAAMEFGLAPGQIRSGLRLLGAAIQAFENFVGHLGHDIYFAEPLHYHNAVIFEQYGFAYEKGRRLMERIQRGFEVGGDLLPLLDCSTPFRRPSAANSIRLRSWAIQDNIMGSPFTDVTMYKRIGKSSSITTCFGCTW